MESGLRQSRDGVSHFVMSSIALGIGGDDTKVCHGILDNCRPSTGMGAYAEQKAR